jgi:hypothetical protein
MSTPVNNLIANITNYQYNPAGIQSAVLKTLTDATNGNITIVDPTNPFVFCLEAAAVMTAAYMAKNEANTRKQYPYSAQNMDDLYLHMSDVDYINRFAMPSSTQFSILIPMTELLSKLVLDPTTGIRKVVIPRNSYFTVLGIDFSIQYPIEIRQLTHGGIQVVYDTDVVSPLQTLSTNIINFEIQQNNDDKYLYFTFDTQQFNIISQIGSLTSASDFSVDITLTDYYYYTRVYVEANDGTWVEIKTTHSDQIYDIKTPTAVLRVVDKNVNVKIPQIYTGTGLLNSNIRIDVYQTKGALDLILWEYPFSAFTATWQAYDVNDSNIYTAPLSTFKTIIPFSTSIVSGGFNETTFDDLRNQVIMNAIGSPSLPITNAQITTALSLEGYKIVKNIDNVTNRVFLATKDMPVPLDPGLITPASATVATIYAAMEDLVLLNTVIDNGSSITITPDTIYQNINGITKPLTNDQIKTLLAQPTDQLAISVTYGNYLYTPFHYVLDTSGNEFSLRPYYLDNPVITTKLFVKENDTTLLQVNTDTYSIYRNSTGYEITVVTKSGDAYKSLDNSQVFAQLAYIPEGEKTYAYLNGTLVSNTADNERMFTFNLVTNFNIDSDNNLELINFLMYNTTNRTTKTNLITNFNILYSTTADMGQQWVADSVDTALGRFLLPQRIVGITHEVLRVQFGYSLTTLWASARSVVSGPVYKTWPNDVPSVYEQDVYARDANGSVISFTPSGRCDGTIDTNVPLLTVLYKKGDPVLDNDGNPTYRHRAGDVMLTSDGQPIPISGRSILRQLDIMLLEGAYWFANDVTATNYRKLITQNLIDWLTNDLINIDNKLLEQTNIYFYPNSTLGNISAMVDNGVTTLIDASQSFTVNLSVSELVYNDNDLRTKLTNATITTLGDQLKNSTVSIDSITSALRTQYGNDVISVNITGLGGTNNYTVITIMNNTDRCSLRKRLTAKPSNKLVVEEDITVNFILYQLSN